MRKGFGETQFFEDFRVGDEFEVGPVPFSEESILAFGHQFDPLPFHTDPVAARDSLYGGLIASGWHVLCATFRALIEAGFLRGGAMGSPGIDEVRWKRPVRPGDSLTVTLRVTATRASGSRDDRGYVDLDFAAMNQEGETVTTYRVTEIVKRRPA